MWAFLLPCHAICYNISMGLTRWYRKSGLWMYNALNTWSLTHEGRAYDILTYSAGCRAYHVSRIILPSSWHFLYSLQGTINVDPDPWRKGRPRGWSYDLAGNVFGFKVVNQVPTTTSLVIKMCLCSSRKEERMHHILQVFCVRQEDGGGGNRGS